MIMGLRKYYNGGLLEKNQSQTQISWLLMNGITHEIGCIYLAINRWLLSEIDLNIHFCGHEHVWGHSFPGLKHTFFSTSTFNEKNIDKIFILTTTMDKHNFFFLYK